MGTFLDLRVRRAIVDCLSTKPLFHKRGDCSATTSLHAWQTRWLKSMYDAVMLRGCLNLNPDSLRLDAVSPKEGIFFRIQSQMIMIEIHDGLISCTTLKGVCFFPFSCSVKRACKKCVYSFLYLEAEYRLNLLQSDNISLRQDSLWNQACWQNTSHPNLESKRIRFLIQFWHHSSVRKSIDLY